MVIRLGATVELLGSADHQHYGVRCDDKRESIVYPADGVIITRGRATRRVRSPKRVTS